jgi:hypothetical protein
MLNYADTKFSPLDIAGRANARTSLRDRPGSEQVISLRGQVASIAGYSQTALAKQ